MELGGELAKRIEIGDVFSFPVSGGIVLLQFIGKHQLMGECALCCKADTLENADFRKGKIFFYPVKLNLRNGNIHFVQHTSPLASVPAAIRRPFVANRKVQYWFVDTLDETKKITELSEEQIDYPIGTGVSHVVLKEIFEGIPWFLFEDQTY